jgi:hypothetical protein
MSGLASDGASKRENDSAGSAGMAELAGLTGLPRWPASTSKNTDASTATAQQLKMIVIFSPVGMAASCRCN